MVTGIEIGPDSCAVVAVRLAGRTIGVSALHVVERGSSSTVQLAETLAALRRTRRFPRRARAVVWGAPEVSGVHDPVIGHLLRPFVDAGFRIESTCTPPQALVTLASTRRRPDSDAAVAWMSINTHGAAIAIVRGQELLYSRTFSWSYAPGRAGSTAQLLQRYTLVAHLAPELQHGIAAVRASHDCGVDTAVTCGDLPDLRSLTMPLIEELDLEVETLDSLEGFQVIGSARGERFAENAPALRLAIAAALGPIGSRWHAGAWRAWQAAAVVGAAAGLLWLAYGVRGISEPAPVSTPGERAAATPTRPSAEQTSAATSRAEPRAPDRTPAAQQTPVPTPRIEPAPTPPPGSSARPQPTPGAASPPAAAAAVTRPVPAAGPTTIVARPEPAAPVQMSPAPRVTTPPPPRTAESRARAPVPLQAPLPRLDSILVDGDRRLAVLDGQIVGIGGRAGDRTVVRIEPDAVVLREPSGLEVRVAIGGATDRLSSY